MTNQVHQLALPEPRTYSRTESRPCERRGPLNLLARTLARTPPTGRPPVLNGI